MYSKHASPLFFQEPVKNIPLMFHIVTPISKLPASFQWTWICFAYMIPSICHDLIGIAIFCYVQGLGDKKFLSIFLPLTQTGEVYKIVFVLITWQEI